MHVRMCKSKYQNSVRYVITCTYTTFIYMCVIDTINQVVYVASRGFLGAVEILQLTPS